MSCGRTEDDMVECGRNETQRGAEFGRRLAAAVFQAERHSHALQHLNIVVNLKPPVEVEHVRTPAQ